MREIERMDMENGSETKIKSNKANIKKKIIIITLQNKETER